MIHLYYIDRQVVFMRRNWIRLITQIISFAFITLVAIGGILVWVPEGSLHAFCPFGGVETVMDLVTTGDLVRQAKLSSVVLGAAVLLLTLLMGPVFCSHICPLGSVQEWIGKLGRRLFPRRYNTIIPRKVHNVLVYLRYAVLVWVVWVTARAGYLIFTEIDPYFALMKWWAGEAAPTAIAVLVGTLGLSFIVERPWCKYLCPYGGLLGIIGLIAPIKIRRNNESCVSCTVCDRSCPMGIEVSKKDTVRSTLCNRCMECVGSCPKSKTLSLRLGKGK